MLPLIDRKLLDVRPIDWTGLPDRFVHPGELEVLIALFRSVKPRVVIEFGCNEGRTAKAILREIENIEHYAGVDVTRGYVPAMAVQRHEVPDFPGRMVADDPRFRLIVRPRGSLDLAAADLPECDAVFIDGDHGRAAVEHDTALAFARLRPGGIVVWHDYHDLETVDVRDVLDDMAAAGAPILHVAGTWIAFQKKTL